LSALPLFSYMTRRDHMKNVLMIAGSLRKNSFNHQLAAQVKEMLEGRAEVSFLEFADLPFMNQDIEFPAPESVARVRQAVREADGIWIFSPEYNYQIPGVVKNLLDWLSRPLIPNDPQRNTVVKGKVAAISSAAGKSAGAGVRKNLSSLLEIMSMKVVGGMGTGVALDGEAFRTNRLLLSEKDREGLKEQLELFLSAL